MRTTVASAKYEHSIEEWSFFFEVEAALAQCAHVCSLRSGAIRKCPLRIKLLVKDRGRLPEPVKVSYSELASRFWVLPI